VLIVSLTQTQTSEPKVGSLMSLHDFSHKYYDTLRPKEKKTTQQTASDSVAPRETAAHQEASDEPEEHLDEVATEYLGNAEEQPEDEDEDEDEDDESHKHDPSDTEDRGRPQRQQQPRGRPAVPHLLYLPSHPYFSSRSLATRTDKTIDKIVIIHSGPSPPDHMKARSVLADAGASVAAKEAATTTLDLYAKMGLVLFSRNGWRSPADLKPAEYGRAIDYFDYLYDHKQLAPCASTYLSRWQDWYARTVFA
jgi:hypothetical protein